MTAPALAFELGCIDCGGALEMLFANTPRPRRTGAMLHCPTCHIDLQVTVSVKARRGDDRRHDVDALINWVTSRNDTTKPDTRNSPMEYTANRLGITRDALHYFKVYGLPDLEADEFATRLNVHPTAIWPGFYDDVLVDDLELVPA